MKRIWIAMGACALGASLAPLARSQCPEWTPGFRIEPQARDVVTFDDGSGPALYLGGGFLYAGDVAARRIARWDGANFAPLGTGLDSAVYALAVHDDGSGTALYAGGTFAEAGGVPAARIARWDGTSWSPLASGLGGGRVDRLGSFAGDLVAFGSFTSAGGQPASGFATWDGVAWSAPSAGVHGQAYATAVFDSGSGPNLWLAGWFDAVGGVPAHHLAYWDGATWSPGGEPDRGVRALQVFDDGTGPALYAAGDFSILGNVVVSTVARFDGTSWSATGQLPAHVSGLAVFDDGGGARLYALTNSFPVPEPHSELLRLDAGGWSVVGNGPYRHSVDFDSLRATQIGGSARLVATGFVFDGMISFVDWATALWDGSQWSYLGKPDKGMHGSVLALAKYDAGGGPEIVAGGDFFVAGDNIVGLVARWDGSEWQDLQGGISGLQVRALVEFDDGGGPELILAGEFDCVGGGYFCEGGLYPAGNVARWDGSSWSAMGEGVSRPVNALCVADLGAGPRLVLGGEFTSTSSGPASRVAVWDGTRYSALGRGVNGRVQAIAQFGGELYVGGSFSKAGDVFVENIACWNGSSWSAVGLGVDDDVQVLLSFDDGGGPDLYVGGAFANAGGQPASRIARWDGSAWSAVGGGISAGPNDRVDTLVDASGTLAGRALVAGGTFTEAGGVPARSLARWDGQAWSGVREGTDGGVHSLAVLDDALWVGGLFQAVGSTPSTSIARLTDPCGAAPQGPFCFGTEADCPCGNAGTAGAGCDNGQGTGGVRLSLGDFVPDGVGGGTATLAGSGFPPAATPSFVALRAAHVPLAPQVFGDGLLCIGPANVVRVGSGIATAGSAQAALSHGAGPGSFYYQLWYRSQPASFCDPVAAFNLSNGYELTW